MRTATCKLKSASPYSQSKYINEKKTRDETHADFEKRSWQQRCHWGADGMLQMPSMGFKNCLSEAAKYNAIQIPGKGKSTYTKHFEAGVLVVKPLVLSITRETLGHEWLHVPSDGRRGGTTRVEKCFPLILDWQGVVEFLVFDNIITNEVFESHLNDAGAFIGVGRFRPRNNGYYGRFSVESISWA